MPPLLPIALGVIAVIVFAATLAIRRQRREDAVGVPWRVDADEEPVSATV